MQHSWQTIYQYTQQLAEREPLLRPLFEQAVLQHTQLSDALAWLISDKLHSTHMPVATLQPLLRSTLREMSIESIISEDLYAIKSRDCACQHIANAFLFYKGFHALQSYRVAHHLWNKQQHSAALFFQSRSSSVFNVDIHPAAILGKGIMLDHATGIVIGETARVGDQVSIMQGVTLGGTGKEHFDRHPKIGNGVLISCGAKILGNIQVGDGAKIAAGSVVLHSVEKHTTVAGVPAIVVGKPQAQTPALDMNHNIDCDMVVTALKNKP